MTRLNTPDNLCLDLPLTNECILLGLGLEPTVSELGGSVDKLERLRSLLEVFSGGVGHHALSQGHDTLLDTWARSLDEDDCGVM